VPKKIKRLEAEELAQEAKETGASFVVITGGEPTVHDLDPLCFEIRMLDMDAHLETCGAFKFTHEAFDWVTLSPKWDKLPLAENLLRADELKLIIEDEDSIQKWIDAICQIAGTSTLAEAIHPNAQVWLHPEWSHREDPVVLQKIANHVKLHGGPFRAGWQLHKLYRVDALDHRAASNAPLGGDPTLGY
jgi:organic radical activating enzyme